MHVDRPVSPDGEYASPEGAADAESRVRGTVFLGLREAARDVWGDQGLRVLAAALPHDARVATVDNSVRSSGLYPERWTVAWFNAAYEVVARRSDRDFHAFLDGMMDHGFGRVRRALLRLATPAFLIEQAAGLWRHDHSRGLVTSEVQRGVGHLHLIDHDYVNDPVSRAALAEIYRYGVQLTGARDVTVSHSLSPSHVLTCTIRWRT